MHTVVTHNRKKVRSCQTRRVSYGLVTLVLSCDSGSKGH